MLEIIGPIAFLAGLIVLFVIVLARALASSRKAIDQWAKSRGFRIERCEWRCSRWQLLCRVRIIDGEGWTRSAWVRSGSPLIGMIRDDVEVRWVRPTEI